MAETRVLHFPSPSHTYYLYPITSYRSTRVCAIRKRIQGEKYAGYTERRHYYVLREEYEGLCYLRLLGRRTAGRQQRQLIRADKLIC